MLKGLINIFHNPYLGHGRREISGKKMSLEVFSIGNNIWWLTDSFH